MEFASRDVLLDFRVRSRAYQFVVDTEAELKQRLLSIGTRRIVLRTIRRVQLGFRWWLLSVSSELGSFQASRILFEII